jgi:hypothetical protein
MGAVGWKTQHPLPVGVGSSSSCQPSTTDATRTQRGYGSQLLAAACEDMTFTLQLQSRCTSTLAEPGFGRRPQKYYKGEPFSRTIFGKQKQCTWYRKGKKYKRLKLGDGHVYDCSSV